MIYLFTGDDTQRKYLSYETFLKSLPKDTERFFIGKNDFDQSQVESFFSGSGLFFDKCIIVFTNIFESEDIASFIVKKLDLIKDSKNDFIFLEDELDIETIDEFKKARSEINMFELTKMRKERYDNFLLANAFGARNKFMLWWHFRQAVEKGVVMEELIGVLFWKAKDMLLNKNYGKFKKEELESFATYISYILPEARKEGMDAETAFEKFLLESF